MLSVKAGSLISARNLKKDFQSQAVIGDISIDLQAGDFVALVGPNGCGKSTLLNILSGLMGLEQGCGQLALNVPLNKVGYLFQDSRNLLMPWRSSYSNLAFPLELHGVSRDEIKEKVGALATLFCFGELNKFPYQLSGGQLQKLAFMRTLINSPQVLLIDEPFSAVDYENCLLLRGALQEYFIKNNLAVLIVTHNVEEAVHLANKIIMLSKKPSKVVKVLDNPAPYPRPTGFLVTMEFHTLKESVLCSLQKEAGLGCRA